MKKRTYITYYEVDVKKIVRDELAKATPDWIEEITRNVTQPIAKFKDEVMTMLDKVMGELKTIREEQTLIGGKQSEHTDEIEDHDLRLKKLEKTAGFASNP